MLPKSLAHRLHLLLIVNFFFPVLAFFVLVGSNYIVSYLARDIAPQIGKTISICIGIIMAALGVGTIVIGVWTTIQIARGNWDQPASLGSWLIIAGLFTIVCFIGGAVTLEFLDACMKNGCL
jgi:hypothetical protein